MLKVLLLIVGVVSANPAWKLETSYYYEIKGLSLIGVKAYNSGVKFHGKLHINVRDNGALFGEVLDLQYCQVTSNCMYENLKTLMNDKKFQIEMENGVINDVIVEKTTYNWEANIIKGILSQLQLNTNTENIINDKINVMPENNSGIFKVMEETVTGKMETLYNIHSNKDFIEIIKHKNYNNIKENIQYHYGLTDDDFIKRSSYGRAIIVGNLTNYRISNSYTNNEVIVKPTLTDTEYVKMKSVMNLTLLEFKSAKVRWGQLITFSDETISLGGLSYTYNLPYSSNLVRNNKNHKQNKPNLINEPDVPFLPYTVGFNGNSIKFNKYYNITQDVEQVLHILKNIDIDELSPELFLHLTSLLKIMNFDELERISEKYYSNYVFLDALSHSGTGSAFLILQQLILMRKVPMFQASLLLTTFTSNVLEPTEELLEVYFKFVQKQFVQEQLMLNHTALLSFTNFVRNVYVNEKISETKYPVHTFGSFNTINGKLFVVSTVLPYLNNNLKKSIVLHDVKKAHLYIRAIGNIGHPEILKLFEPYLEGVKYASKFQRFWMVLSLDKLIETYPIIAQSVFYRIYMNIGEIEEIRVAAVDLLMKTYPSLEMLQTVAEYTNFDKNKKVNAAVKASFDSAARIKDEKLTNFRLSVEKAKIFLNKQQNIPEYSAFNIFYSIHIVKQITNNRLFNFDEFLSNNIPFQVHSFNFEEFIYKLNQFNYFYKINEEKILSKIKGDIFFSTKLEDELEGLLSFNIGDYNNIFSFDNYTVSSIPKVLQMIEKQFRPRLTISKWFNSKQITIGFPTETGLPCIYTYNAPIHYALNGNFKVETKPKLSDGEQIHQPSEVIGNFDYTMLFKMKIIGELKILTPFDCRIYTSTYQKYSQVYLPLKNNFLFNLNNFHFKIEIIPKEELLNKVPLFHFNTKVFNSDSFLISQNFDSKSIVNQLNRLEKHFGEKENGMALKLSIIQDGQFLKDLFSNDILYRNVSVHFDGKKSDNKVIIIKIGYKDLYKTEPTSAHNVLKYFKDHLNLIKNDLNYHNMNIGIYNLFIEFKGQHNIEHILKFVCGNSNIDPKSLVLIEYLKKSKKTDSLLNRLTLHASNYIPNINEIDLNYTIHNSPIIYSNLQLIYGVKKNLNNIKADIKLERSNERKNDILKSSNIKKCLADISLIPQCIELMKKMNFYDQLTIDIGYKNVTDEFKLVLEHIYYFYRSLNYFNMKIDKEILQNNKTSFKILMDPELIKDLDLIRLPICAFHHKQITTFTMEMYSFELLHQWQYLFKYSPKYRQLENYMILIRKNDNLLHTDVKLFLRTPQTGNTVEINLIAGLTKNNLTNITAELMIDGKIVKNFTNKTLDFQNGYIQIYALPNNVYKTLVDNEFYLIYDGFNVKVSIINFHKYLNNIDGLCKGFNPQHNYANIISNNDWIISPNSDKCIRYKQRYIEEENDEICFTIHPVPYLACQCKQIEYVKEYFPVYCTNLTQTAKLWKHYIRQGGNPDFSHLNTTDNIAIRVPKLSQVCN